MNIRPRRLLGEALEFAYQNNPIKTAAHHTGKESSQHRFIRPSFRHRNFDPAPFGSESDPSF